MGELVPFGKYMGKPVEAMASDHNYIKWLTAQDWFKQKYQSIYQTIIVNNFGEPAETPEHNEMQAKFLEPLFRFQVAVAANPVSSSKFLAIYSRSISSRLSSMKYRLLGMRERAPFIDMDKEAASRWDQMVAEGRISFDLRLSDTEKGVLVDVTAVTKGSKFSPGDVERKESSEFTFRPPVKVGEVSFENRGVDVVYDVSSLWFNGQIRCEIKPCVSDDYPAVLRQMTASKSDTILVRQYSSSAVPIDAFVKIFSASKISVVFESDAEKISPEILPVATAEFLKQEIKKSFGDSVPMSLSGP